MMNTEPKNLRTFALWAMGTAVFFVLALWGFWQEGLNALGFNATLYLLGLIGLFSFGLDRNRGLSWREQLPWLVPLVLVALSYSMYENPFLKAINFLAVPAALVLFVNSAARKPEKSGWGMAHLFKVVSRFFSALLHIQESGRGFSEIFGKLRGSKSLAARIAVGLFVFLMVALAVVIPLLASIDPMFADAVRGITDWFQELMSASAVARIFFAFLLSIFTLAAVLAWTKPYEWTHDSSGKTQQVDEVVTGVIIGGLLAVYLLFLGIQVRHLWVGSLPFDFSQTVSFVKSGFWQMFFLTLLNLLIYVSVHRRTGKAVQGLLAAFTGASLLLLASAGQRVVLYVWNYGLSYEKFFAFYTVVFCGLLMGWLFYALLAKRQTDVMKFSVTLLLWMFAIVSILPVENIILRTNMALVQRENTRVRLYELSMLSLDVLPTVEKCLDSGCLKEQSAYYMGLPLYIDPQENWEHWVSDQKKKLETKSWYEMNIGNVCYLVGR